MSGQREREEPDPRERSVWKPAWWTVTWVNPDLVGRIQRNGTPVADMWPASMKRAVEPQPEHEAVKDEPELEAGA